MEHYLKPNPRPATLSKMSLRPYLKRLLEARERLSRPEAAALLREILDNRPADIELAALLGALAARGETPDEIAGFVDTLRFAATPIPLHSAEQAALVDTCGTGGDASGTFNISTAAALVAAAAGATVAKHGNRAVTSLCGSADVLEALGIPVNLTPGQAAQTLREHHFAFLHAPALHPAMRAVMPVRRVLGVRTVFNILGPLANPAGASRQVMGVYAPHLVPLVAEAMANLGIHHALVVHGDAGPSGGRTDIRGIYAGPSGLDELSISGPSQIAEIRNRVITRYILTPEDAGLTRSPIDTLRGGGAQTNAAILTDIFAGRPGPPRDVVLLNAAAVLVTADLAPDLLAGIALAARTVDTGMVTDLIRILSLSPQM